MARDHREVVERALQLKKAGNAADARRRRARDPPDQRPRRRLLPRADAGRARAACVEELERAREFALEAVRLDGGAAVPGLRGGLRVRRAARRRTTTRSRAGGWSRARGLDIAPARVRGARRRGARRALDRAALAAARRHGATSSARWPATRSTATGCRRLAREAADAAGLEPVVPQPVPQHRRARGRDPLRARRGAAAHRRLRAARPAGRRGRAARGRRVRLDRGAARPALAPLRDRRRGHDPRRADRAADLAEPGPRSSRASTASSSSTSTLADDELRLRCEQADPQLRPVHLLRDALPAPGGRPRRDRRHRRGQRAGAATTAPASRSRGACASWRPPASRSARSRATRRRWWTLWAGAEHVVVVDAARSGAPPGTVRRFDARSTAAAGAQPALLDARLRRRGRRRAGAIAGPPAGPARRLRDRGRELRRRRQPEPVGRAGRRRARG